jgi:hypothetical protein
MLLLLASKDKLPVAWFISMFNTSTCQVRRVQSLVETLDKLKARNANPFSDHNNAVSVTTQWETFENGMGSLSAPPPHVPSEQVNTNWEQQFD